MTGCEAQPQKGGRTKEVRRKEGEGGGNEDEQEEDARTIFLGYRMYVTRGGGDRPFCQQI